MPKNLITFPTKPVKEFNSKTDKTHLVHYGNSIWNSVFKKGK